MFRRHGDNRGATMDYSKPTQFLVDEHAVIVRVLDAVEAVARRDDDPMDVEFFEKAIEFFACFADKCHHAKEEDLLFPVLEQRGVPRDGGPIGCMLSEHVEAIGWIIWIETRIFEKLCKLSSV